MIATPAEALLVEIQREYDALPPHPSVEQIAAIRRLADQYRALTAGPIPVLDVLTEAARIRRVG